MRIRSDILNHLLICVSLPVLVLPAGGLLPAVPCGAQEPAAEAPEAAIEEEPEWMKSVQSEDPAVAAILETRPSTPAELLRAASILADLKRPDLAKEMVKQVAEANLDAAVLASVVDQLGEAALVEMGSKTDLRPEITPLIEKALGANQARVRDAARLAEFANQLASDDPKTRADAAVGLIKAGPYAVAPLMDVLGDPDRASEHEAATGVLLRLGPDAVKPLIAMLDVEDPDTVRAAISALGRIGDKGAALYLLAAYAEHYDDDATRQAASAALERLMAAEPNREEAVQVLMDRSQRYFDGRQVMETDADGNVPMWVYDPRQKTPGLLLFPPDAARRRMAVKLARAATILLPDDPAAARLHLTCVFEEAAHRKGLDAVTSGELDSFADQIPAEILETVLAEAMATGHIPAAIIAARRLATAGSAEMFSSGNGVAPLVAAMQHPDRRLRLAAVGAVLDLNPAVAFPGAGRVIDTLAFFAASRGQSRALILGPRVALLQTLFGELGKAGFKVDTAVTGNEAMRLLLSNPDYEVLFVDAALNEPDVDTFLQQLRRDPRTALLPVAVLAREGYDDRAERVAQKIPATAAFPRPNDEQAVKWQLEELRKLAGDSSVSASSRLAHAAQSLARLAHLGETESPLFDVRQARGAVMTALKAPETMDGAIRVLQTIPSPESQETLVELASRISLPIEVRQAAAAAFAQSVNRCGVQLTVPRIQKQYDRYNASERHDKPTQAVLGSILDAIEKQGQAEEDKEQ